jgi:hypothetical protein
MMAGVGRLMAVRTFWESVGGWVLPIEWEKVRDFMSNIYYKLFPI